MAKDKEKKEVKGGVLDITNVTEENIVDQIKNANKYSEEIVKLAGEKAEEKEKERMIKEAEGQAEAVLKVQSATAEGLRMIKEAGADDAVLTLKSLEAFAKAADGKATKIIIPSDIQGIAGLAASLKEVMVDKKTE